MRIIFYSLLISLSFSLYADDDQEWQFELTPYLWAAGIDGDISTGGNNSISSPIDNDYSFFVLENLDLAGFLAFEAKKSNWRFMTDGMYIKYSDTINRRFIDYALEVEGTILEGAVAYALPDYPMLEVLAGGRAFFIENNIALNPGPDRSGSQNWVDPFLGLRYSHVFNDKWYANLRGDIGGFGIASEMMYNAAVTVGYHFNDTITGKFGYRYLSADFEKDLFRYDVAVSGFGLGVGFKF